MTLLRERTRHDLAQYKPSTLLRRIARRRAVHGMPTLTAYTEFLRQNSQEIDLMFKEMLIGVTSFFRDPEVWQARSACWSWALTPAVLRFGEPLLDCRQGEWCRADTDGFLPVQLNDSTTGPGVVRVETQRPDGVLSETIGASFDNCKPSRRGCVGAILFKDQLCRVARHCFRQELLRLHPLVRTTPDIEIA